MEIKDFIAIGTLLIASLSLFFSIREYIKRGNKERADFFLRLRDRLKGNEQFMNIQSLVEADDDTALERIPTQQLNNLIGFYEEIYLFSKGNFISKDVLYYMFGEYALDCYQNKVIQKRLDLGNKSYWKKFNDFCEDYLQWKNSNASFEFTI